MADLPACASDAWLANLPATSADRFRRKLKDGGRPVFIPAPDSTTLHPSWYVLLKGADDSLSRVVSRRAPLCRRIDSLRVAYGLAAAAGLESLCLIIHKKDKQ